MICLRGILKRNDTSKEWTWEGVWAFGSAIQQQEGLPFSYQFSHPTNDSKKTEGDAKEPPSRTTDEGAVGEPKNVISKELTKEKAEPLAVAPQSTKEENQAKKEEPPAIEAEAAKATEPSSDATTKITTETLAPKMEAIAPAPKMEPPETIPKPTAPAVAAAAPAKEDASPPPQQPQGETKKEAKPQQGDTQPKEFTIRDNITVPASGQWKGSFEALMPSRKGEQRTTIHELFTIAWDSKDIQNDRSEVFHVTGSGQNQFGNFKLVGSWNPKDFVLQCHREYIIAPPPAPRSYQTRKRQLSWKRRDDIYEDTKPVIAKRTTASAKKTKTATATNTGGLTIQIPTIIPMGNTKRIQASAGALPSVPDPYMARWRSAHFLYYYTSPDTNDPSKYVVYEGEMVHGMRDGRGICLYNNGLLYEGEWKDDREHGHGTLQTADRKMIVYQGEWERGRLHGRGTYYYHENAKAQKSSEHEPPRHFYQGEFRENLRNGTGHYQLSDGSTYNGGWREGTMSGRGIFTWPDGSVYDGDWKDNKRHGHGILRASDGFSYDGTWVHNAMDGRGSATYKNGQEYHGMWSRGRREGRGTIHFTNGAVYEGRFRDDAIDGQGTLKISKTLLVSSKMTESSESSTKTPDFMIPLSFQSDLGRIHQMAGFTSVGQ